MGEMDIQVSVGLDAKQLEDWHSLWVTWAMLENIEFNEKAWYNYTYASIASGQFMPIVAYAGEMPVGMVEWKMDIDPMDGRLTGFGDHAFVMPEYRDQQVFKKLYEACDLLCKLYETECDVLPVSNEAGFLRKFYRSVGFEESGWLMRREVSH